MLVLLLGLQEQGTGPLCISGLHKGQRTRGKVTLTFLKSRRMIDLVFNLCVHLPCWGSKIRRGKCLAMAWPQVHQHLALPHHCFMQHTPWPGNWWTRSPNLPGLAPFCYPLHCLCCAMDEKLAAHIDVSPVLRSAPSHRPHLSAEQIWFLWWALNEQILRAWTAVYIYRLYTTYWFIVRDFLVEQNWTSVFVMGKNYWLQYDQSLKFW